MSDNVDSILNQLMTVKYVTGKCALSESEVIWLCHTSKDIFLAEPMLLKISAPIKVCGDIHGQFFDLLRLFRTAGHPSKSNYLFLGDYVDRGKLSLETISLLLAFKIKRPNNFFLLRGNHECSNINRVYGFYDDCKRKFNVKVWKTFNDCFNCLPVAAVIDETIFCCHGGLSPHLNDLDEIRSLQRPTIVPGQGLLCDLLWSDPDDDAENWGPNDRGISYTFSKNVIDKFLTKHNLDLIIRAHQVVEDGYLFFGKDKKLVTVFSAPNYCGQFENSAAVINITKQLQCSFLVMKPLV